MHVNDLTKYGAVLSLQPMKLKFGDRTLQAAEVNNGVTSHNTDS